MQLYSHVLDLRIWHPTLDPDIVTRTLGLAPEVTWRAGEPRKTPKGTLLQGIRSEGYWASDPFSYGWRESTDAQLEDALEELVSFLEPHREFLSELSREGTVRIWASTHSKRNFAVELPPTCLGGWLHLVPRLYMMFIRGRKMGPDILFKKDAPPLDSQD